MQHRRQIYLTLLLLFALATILFVIINFQNNKELKVVFINVGQGDSILISQGSNQMLIDGGKDGKLLMEKLGKLIPFWDRTIETVVETHPDQDHIGGLIEVMQNYKVGAVIKTNAQSDSQTFKVLEEKIKANGANEVEARKGLEIKLSDQTEAQVLFPLTSLEKTISKDTNENSVVVRFAYGSNSFLFTGDLPINSEAQILNDKINVEAQVLKIGHHGSKYSSSDEFLTAVKPEDAIISVGKNNSYGHPNQDVLQKLIKHGINILRTDEMGDIAYKCKDVSTKCFLAK